MNSRTFSANFITILNEILNGSVYNVTLMTYHVENIKIGDENELKDYY